VAAPSEQLLDFLARSPGTGLEDDFKVKGTHKLHNRGQLYGLEAVLHLRYRPLSQAGTAGELDLG